MSETSGNKDFMRANIVNRSDPSGARRKGQSISCACGAIFWLNNARGSGLPPEVVIKKAVMAGWEASLNGRHTCPDCVKERGGKRPAEKAATPLVVVPAAPQPEEAPMKRTVEEKPEVVLSVVESGPDVRQPSPAQRRTIFRTIEGTYDEVNGRYTEGATDASLAKFLSFPRKWIETIREENFGPAGPDPRLSKLVAEIEAQRAAIARDVATAMDWAAKLEAAELALTALGKRVAEALQ